RGSRPADRDRAHERYARRSLTRKRFTSGEEADMVRNEGPGRRRLTEIVVGAGLIASLLAAAAAPQAQDRQAAGTSDPRVGLKPGFRDAGQAASNLELVASLPRPNGFFDPAAPSGAVAPPERDDDTAKPAAATAEGGQKPAG